MNRLLVVVQGGVVVEVAVSQGLVGAIEYELIDVDNLKAEGKTSTEIDAAYDKAKEGLQEIG